MEPRLRERGAMFDDVEFENGFSQLIGSGKYDEAEQFLLTAYSEFKAANNRNDLDFVIGHLAHFYSFPESEDLAKAEHYCLEREVLSPGTHPKLQTAWFYFYTTCNFPETIKKVDEIAALKDADGINDYYSALAVKGHALLNLDRTEEAADVLRELLMMIKTNPPRFPFGDEMNFLEAAKPQQSLAPLVREILTFILPNMRSQQYVKRGKALLV